MAPYLRIVVAAASVILPLARPAFAHHAMGGELPSTAWQGLLSGLGHPVIGIDHLAFVLGVGLMADLAGWSALLPLLFIAGTVLGCVIHMQGYGLPAPEFAIAITVAMAAAIVATRAKLPLALHVTLFVVTGAVHGYAYGESIVGAETAPLAAYIVGFGAVQYVLALGSGLALHTLVGRDYLSETKAMRIAGGGLALLAALAFVNVALMG